MEQFMKLVQYLILKFYILATVFVAGCSYNPLLKEECGKIYKQQLLLEAVAYDYNLKNDPSKNALKQD